MTNHFNAFYDSDVIDKYGDSKYRVADYTVY